MRPALRRLRSWFPRRTEESPVPQNLLPRLLPDAPSVSFYDLGGFNESQQEVATAAQSLEIPIVFDWELMGIYSTEKGLSALFNRQSGKTAKDKYRRIALGADLDGWKLTEVHQDKVLVKQGDQQKELLLRKVKVKDSSKKMNVPNKFNVPKPEDVQMPVQGELENTHE